MRQTGDAPVSPVGYICEKVAEPTVKPLERLQKQTFAERGSREPKLSGKEFSFQYGQLDELTEGVLPVGVAPRGCGYFFRGSQAGRLAKRPMRLVARLQPDTELSSIFAGIEHCD